MWSMLGRFRSAVSQRLSCTLPASRHFKIYLVFAEKNVYNLALLAPCCASPASATSLVSLAASSRYCRRCATDSGAPFIELQCHKMSVSLLTMRKVQKAYVMVNRKLRLLTAYARP